MHLGEFCFILSFPFNPFDSKENDLKLSQFKVTVILGSMWDFLTPRYPGLRFCFPRDMEACILDVQVNVGIQFPLCEDLEELCRYYDIAPTQLVSHALQMCAWYCLMCTRHSWTYPPFVVFTDWLGHQPLLLFQHRLPKFIEWCSEGWNLPTNL